LTTEPDRVSRAPALAANATGMSRAAGRTPVERAVASTTGIMAAAAPLGVTRADSTAVTSMSTTRRATRLVPTLVVMRLPTHAVRPEASRPSATTKRLAMKTTTGSPNPPSAVGRSMIPRASRDNDVRMATTPTGTLLEMKRATQAASTRRVSVASDTVPPFLVGPRKAPTTAGQ